jgi:hypothetical protein
MLCLLDLILQLAMYLYDVYKVNKGEGRLREEKRRATFGARYFKLSTSALVVVAAVCVLVGLTLPSK